MSTDPRLTALKLASNWHAKVERNELELDNAFDLLVERIGSIVSSFSTCPTCGLRPCPDPGFCQSCRVADQEIAAARRCAQCGAGGGTLDPHKDQDRRRVVYLHPRCLPFWRKTHR
jgi:hypothetical protein